MKIIGTVRKTVVACGLALGFIVCHLAAEPLQKDAVVVNVSGSASYAVPGGEWLPLVKGFKLIAGTTVQTGPDSSVDLSIREPLASIHLGADTTLKLEKMVVLTGDARDTETQINLRSGEVMGDVKKLSKASHFDIKTPNGVAGIRGTKFRVKAEPQGDGSFKVSFFSLEGELVVAALVTGQVDPVVQVLNTGEMWIPGNEIMAISAEQVAQWIRQIEPYLTAMTGGEGAPHGNFFFTVPSPASPSTP